MNETEFSEKSLACDIAFDPFSRGVPDATHVTISYSWYSPDTDGV